jgi:hypothetical protein
VSSAPHLKGGELLHDGVAAHPDLFVEACRCCDVGDSTKAEWNSTVEV